MLCILVPSHTPDPPSPRRIVSVLCILVDPPSPKRIVSVLCILVDPPSPRRIVSVLCILVLGTSLTIRGEAHVSWLGLGIALSAQLCDVGKILLQTWVLQRCGTARTSSAPGAEERQQENTGTTEGGNKKYGTFAAPGREEDTTGSEGRPRSPFPHAESLSTRADTSERSTCSSAGEDDSSRSLEVHAGWVHVEGTRVDGTRVDLEAQVRIRERPEEPITRIDPLSFVMLVAPCCIPLLMTKYFFFQHEAEVLVRARKYWGLILFNCTNAFLLNVAVAFFMRHASALR